MSNLCECGAVVEEPTPCVLCLEGTHFAWWNYLAVVPGACSCTCSWDRRAGQETQ